MISDPPVWRTIDRDTSLASVMPSDRQPVWLDNGVSYILGYFRQDLAERGPQHGRPARPWCDRFGNSLPRVPRAWRVIRFPRAIACPGHQGLWDLRRAGPEVVDAVEAVIERRAV